MIGVGGGVVWANSMPRVNDAHILVPSVSFLRGSATPPGSYATDSVMPMFAQLFLALLWFKMLLHDPAILLQVPDVRTVTNPDVDN